MNKWIWIALAVALCVFAWDQSQASEKNTTMRVGDVVAYTSGCDTQLATELVATSAERGAYITPPGCYVIRVGAIAGRLEEWLSGPYLIKGRVGSVWRAHDEYPKGADPISFVLLPDDHGWHEATPYTTEQLQRQRGDAIKGKGRLYPTNSADVLPVNDPTYKVIAHVELLESGKVTSRWIPHYMSHDSLRDCNAYLRAQEQILRDSLVQQYKSALRKVLALRCGTERDYDRLNAEVGA